MIPQEQREIAAVLHELGMDGRLIAVVTNGGSSKEESSDQQ